MNTYRVPLRTEELPVDVDGQLNVHVEPDVYALIQNGEPFSPDVARGPERVLQAEVTTETGEPLTVGADRSLGLSLEAGTKLVIDLVWPEEDLSPIGDYGLEVGDEEIYLLLSVEGSARLDAAADAELPRYPLSGSLGLQAEGRLHYARALPFSRETPAREVLREFVAGIRLPQSVQTVDDLPEPGELLDLQYSGYLDFGVESSWGYSLKKFTELGIGRLDLESRVDVTSRASLNVTCGIAGEYSFQVRRDEEREDWARVTVRKKRRRTGESALDVQVGVTTATDGLPEEASSFVAALVGTSIPDLVAEMRALPGDPGELVDRLENEVGALTERGVRTLFEKWYPEAQIAEKAEPFLEDLASALDRYEELAGEDGRWTEALSGFTVEELSRSLEKLRAMQERSDLASVAEPIVLRVLRTAAGEQYARMVSSDTTFAEQKDLIEEKLGDLLEVGDDRLLDLFGLSDEVLDVNALVERLREYDSPEELREQAEDYLVELASRLAGRGFEELEDAAELENAFASLKRTLDQLEQLTATAYDRFESALDRSYRAEIGRTYARTEQNEALLDLRIDLTRESGRALIGDVLRGDLTAASRRTAAPFCEVVGGSFTAVTEKTSRLQVSLMGWSYSRVRELAVRSEKSIRQEGDGLIHVYALSARETEVRQRDREKVEFSFLADLMAEGRPDEDADRDLLEVVRELAIEYGFLVEDRSVTEHELKTYLALAQYLGMLPGGTTPDAYVESLRTDLGLEPGDGWGVVTLDYRVRYDPELFLELFATYGERRDESLLRTVYRRIGAANFRGVDRRSGRGSGRSSMHRRIAACLDEYGYYRAHRDGRLDGLVADDVANVLGPLYNYEDDLVDTFSRLHEVVTGDATDYERLADAFEDLADLRNALEEFLAVEEEDVFVNPFFAVIDQMQALKFSEAADRRSSYAELRVEKGEQKLVRVMTG